MTSHLLFSKLCFAAYLGTKISVFCMRPQVMQNYNFIIKISVISTSALCQ